MGILIIGGGICGLGAAMLLARDGHDVTVLERDPQPLPDSLHDCWAAGPVRASRSFDRRTISCPACDWRSKRSCPTSRRRSPAPVRRDSISQGRFRRCCRAERIPIDDKLWTLTARRPVGEWVFAKAAASEPRVTVRRGVQVSSLLTGTEARSGVPHVTGARTTGGEELRADLVVDATGRQSKAPHWLGAIGARPLIDEHADSGFIYYTRYFHGALPERRGPALTALGSISLLTLPADNGTWSVTIFTSAGDQPLKALRHDEVFMKAVAAYPLHAHWLDGTPLGSVQAMGGVVDRYRRFVVDGAPIATGFVALADAWACTNPSAGRGLTVGFLHALRLRDAARRLNDPAALVEEFDARTEAEMRPWYDAQIAVDRVRFAEMNALREGTAMRPVTDPLALGIGGLMSVMAVDPELFRAALEYIGTITPIQQVLARPAVRDAIQAAREKTQGAPPPHMPGPTREQLLAIVESSFSRIR
jgi:2-polyprenyl-6-methoxyphenol hydroxylase-like FAD-dependent oxidoreductase